MDGILRFDRLYIRSFLIVGIWYYSITLSLEVLGGIVTGMVCLSEVFREKIVSLD
jgi:hypothetical protein